MDSFWGANPEQVVRASITKDECDSDFVELLQPYFITGTASYLGTVLINELPACR